MFFSVITGVGIGTAACTIDITTVATVKGCPVATHDTDGAAIDVDLRILANVTILTAAIDRTLDVGTQVVIIGHGNIFTLLGADGDDAVLHPCHSVIGIRHIYVC